jgi:membrane protease YdiL (CAAX protease family)
VLRIEWLPLAWLRTVMLVLTLYAILPAVSLNLHKIGSRLKLWELNVYYFIIVFWELVAVAILFYLLRSNKIPLNAVGLSGGLSLEGVLYTIGGVVVGGLLYPVVQTLIKSLGWDMFWRRREDRDWFPRTSKYLTKKPGFISMFLIVVICIPILEEIIYRGYVLSVLLQHLDSTFIAFVLTSLIFASIHCLAGIGFMLYIFLGTFVSSFLYWRLGNIYPCILMHSANTLIGEIVIPLIEKRGKKG